MRFEAKHTGFEIVLAGILLLATGCTSTGSSIEEAMSAYDRGNYARALELAGQVQDQATSSSLRMQAAYTCGVSALKLGRPAEAHRHLMVAVMSQDDDLASRALISDGTALLELGRPAEAARAFDRAAAILDGPQRNRALRLAGLAWAESGDPERSRDRMQGTTDAAARYDQSNSWTIQAGAFKTRVNAMNKASQLEAIARGNGIGPVRVDFDRTNALYVVHVGRFTSKRSAERARSMLGRLDCFVQKMPYTGS